MKTSIRSLLLFVTTVAGYIALFTVPRALAGSQADIAYLYIVAAFLVVPTLTCCTTASIAFDVRPNRRSAFRGAIVGIYLMFTMVMILFVVAWAIM